MLKVSSPLVSVDWLYEHLNTPNLVILDATINKVTTDTSEIIEKQQIKNTRFLDIKNKFSDVSSELPNTIQSPEEFSESARQLGICNDSAIVVYDELGIYSSPRVWWVFKAMGHHNVAVLDGGLPAWEKAKLPLEKVAEYIGKKGDFTAKYDQDYISDYHNVFEAISNNNTSVLDARSENRFNGTEPEPRKGLRSGHIPNSINLPYSKLMKDGKMKSKNELKAIFTELANEDNRLIFSCGSGITACILALGAEIAGLNNKSVYDGSWTEWGSR
jgi:thiosulfate/3-mercaptopyruvate sulfurtransferase